MIVWKDTVQPGSGDSVGKSSPFVESLLDVLHVVLDKAVASDVKHTDPDTDSDTDPVKKLLYVFREKPEQGIANLMKALGRSINLRFAETT